MTDLAARPFEVAVGDDEIEDLRTRLAATRWPDQIAGTRWDLGTDGDYLRDLCGYWADGYDWRAHESRFNAFDQFVAEIDGQQIHYVHALSNRADATPLILCHGWPGGAAMFQHVIEPLRDPPEGEPAFHVVIPSLPGFGWSGPTTEMGWDPARIADAFVELMIGLGHEGFIAQGGDWGSMICTQIGLRHAEQISGVHLNMLIALPPDGVTDFTEEELAALAAAGEFLETGAGYSAIQGTKPQTVAYALTDSPAGLAGWMAEKYLAWTDNDGTIDSAVDRDAMLDIFSTYWFSRTAGSSARLYYEARVSGLFGPQGGRVEAPTGAAIFPKELFRPSRRFADASYSIAHWAEYDQGGHFAALEQPEALVADIRTFAGVL